MQKPISKSLVLIALPMLCAPFVQLSYPQTSAAPARSANPAIQNSKAASGTIFDEISDAGEREAFRGLTHGATPTARLQHAEEFISKYPQSWVLAEAYALAANGAMESGQYDRALNFAAASLRILPENPELRVSVADLQARAGMFGLAIMNGREALQELDQFLPPASLPQEKWPEMKRQLQAASYFALGRAEVSQALATVPTGGRAELLQRAIDDLARASECDPRDAEIPYLAGLANVERGDSERAAIQFAIAYRLGGPLEAKALAQLKKLYDSSPTAEATNFRDYINSRPEPKPEPSHPDTITPSKPLPGYAGSAACRQCHPDVYQQWSHTGMAKMFRPYRPENVIGDFTIHNKFYQDEEAQREYEQDKLTDDPSHAQFARMVLDRGRHYFEIMQAGGWRRYSVDYTIGSKWEQAYATRLPNGEIHVFPVQYNLVQKRWVNFWKTLDAPGSPRTDLGQWEKLDVYTSYQANCAICHTSQLRNIQGGGLAVNGLEFREPGIDCEMCHGPAARHVAGMSAGKPYEKQAIDSPVDFSRINASQYMSICAQCHEQSAVRRGETELNYSTQGEFFQHYLQRPFEEFPRKAFYKDGRLRGTAFMVEALKRSRCFREGAATCGSCHDPHSTDAASNPTSLKFRDHPDQMCLQCHASFSASETLERHTHHAAASEGSHCASCHMPRIMDALLFEARSHQIDEIPDAEMTLRFGQDQSPNACLFCHRQKDATWVKVQLASWK